VLLKNNGLLPLHKNLNCIAVIGPNAADVDVLLGNYNGVPSHPVTILEGIQQAASSGTQVLYARGCEVLGGSRRRFASAVQKARRADVAILVLGLSQLIEGEEGQREGVAGGKWSFGDRKVLDLPGFQQELLEAIHATGVPVVLVLLNGSAITVNWAADNIPAILEAWYPGQAGGTAVAEVLFGEYNPAGRLPVTFYKSIDQLPPFEDYNMAGRTYRYIRGEPLYPFGYGLSYSRFDYSNLMVTPSTLHTGDSVTIRVEVSNVGGISGDEVAQLYLQCPEAPGTIKIWHLQGFERLHLDAGEKRIISFTLSGENLETIDVQGKSVLLSGTYRLMTGGYFPGQRIQADLPRTKNLSNVLVGSFVLEA
jgi:beta-glucosidase